jgi:hypothetical protein
MNKLTGKAVEGTDCTLLRAIIQAFTRGREKTTKGSSQNSRYPGPDSNPATPEYNSEALRPELTSTSTISQ